MLLGSVSWLDIIVFLGFAAIYLLRDIGLLDTLICAIQALPFLVLQLPVDIVRERYLTAKKHQLPFTQRTTLFQDLVVRCMRYAFSNVPSRITRVFFTRGVALPFLRFRMFRYGYFKQLVHPIWSEIHRAEDGLKGIWIVEDRDKKPDLFIYYSHGGGFAMGSSYFYLEFLITWISILKESGFVNPAIFALEYTLVPEQTYPHQLGEMLVGYNYVLSIAGDPDQIVVSGDSAGGTLTLSLLLSLASQHPNKKPALATLISPWTNLVSELNRNTSTDYLNVEKLHDLARQYAGLHRVYDPLISPGCCMDTLWWERAMPTKGMHYYYGSEEVFCESIRTMAKRLERIGPVTCHEDESLHAWPFAVLFLGGHKEERAAGLRTVSRDIAQALL